MASAKRASEAQGAGRVRAVAADPDARLQHRRRRRGRHLPGGQPVLPGAVGRGARPGGALPRASRCCRSSIVAPLIGPFLDRFAHGRRWAIGATMAIRAFLCWVLAGSVAEESAWLFARGARRPGVVQGVRRHAGRRRTPSAPPRLHPRQGQRPGLGVRHRRRHDVGADRRARLARRLGLGAALRVRAVRDRHDLRDPAARDQIDSTEGEGDLVLARSARRAPSRRGRTRRPGSPARSPSRCGPTAGPGSCPGSC